MGRPRNTYVSSSGLINRHVKPQIGGIRLQQLRPVQVQTLYAAMLDQGKSARTVRYVHAILHRALEQAVKWNRVARNVTDAVEPPRQERREMQALTPEEARRLLEAACGNRWEALWTLALTTGMREAELLGLRWSDIDFRAGTVTVNQTLAWAGGKHYFSEPKITSRRTIPLTAQALEALKAHRKRQAEERLKAGEAWQDLGLVFCTSTGNLLNPSNLLNRWWRAVLKKAGIELKVRFHDLRHTVATLLLARGVLVKTVQAILGHATASMTLDQYGHVLRGAERQAADTLQRLLGDK